MLALLWYYFTGMLPYALCVLPLFLAARAAWVHKLLGEGRRTTALHEAGLLLFCLFLVFLLSQTLLPRLAFDGGIHIVNRGQVSSVNWIPFRMIGVYWEQLKSGRNALEFWAYCLGNAVVFLPLGFLPALLWRSSTLGRAALWSFLTSLAIELLQLPLPRQTDIDDVILNTLGGVAGYLLFMALLKWALPFVAQCRVQRREDVVTKARRHE